jgi:predicted peroxiredoxin
MLLNQVLLVVLVAHFATGGIDSKVTFFVTIQGSQIVDSQSLAKAQKK